MKFYIIAYAILFVMIAAFAITVYKLLSKQPDVNHSPKEADSTDKTEDSQNCSSPPVAEVAAEEEYSTSNPALSYLRNGRKRQRMHFISYKSPYLGTNETVVYYPRIFSGRKFDDVKGIIVENKFVLLREIFLDRLLPGDICEIIKGFEGHLPTEEQIKKVFEYKDEISEMLLRIGEEKLENKGYLYLCGDKEKDATFNYSMHFATGNEYYTEPDDNVSAFLVMEL